MKKKHKQYHRLHNVVEVFPYTKDKIFSNHLKQLEEISGLKIRNKYMLQYEKGSYAELHTDKQSDLTWTTLLYTSGDLNGDSNINVSDIVLLINLILSGDYLEPGDINSDGNINVQDVVILVQIILNN